MPVKYTHKKVKDDLILLEFNIEGGVLDVSELPEAVNAAPELPATNGICISGRGPVWLYAALAHKYHHTQYVATFEPRLNACIVIMSHVKHRKVGDVIPL